MMGRKWMRVREKWCSCVIDMELGIINAKTQEEVREKEERLGVEGWPEKERSVHC
jgi:hypothetical protein